MIQPIKEDDQAERGWVVRLDGEVLPRVSFLELSNPAVGHLKYGWTTNGYDCWSYRENSGGGVVVVPYTHVNDELLIGAIEEIRPNQGGLAMNLPKGSVSVGEDHLTAARRELNEETGLLNVPVEELPGKPLNPDPSFYDTSEHGTGARVYGSPVPSEWLTRDGEHWRVTADHIDFSKQAVSCRDQEGIGELFFIPWKEAVQLGDMFTVAAVARLIASLEG